MERVCHSSRSGGAMSRKTFDPSKFTVKDLFRAKRNGGGAWPICLLKRRSRSLRNSKRSFAPFGHQRAKIALSDLSNSKVRTGMRSEYNLPAVVRGDSYRREAEVRSPELQIGVPSISNLLPDGRLILRPCFNDRWLLSRRRCRLKRARVVHRTLPRLPARGRAVCR